MIDARTHRVIHVDPSIFTRASQVQRERDMQQMRWADAPGGNWTRVYAGSCGLCAASPLLFGWWSIPFLILGIALAVVWFRSSPR